MSSIDPRITLEYRGHLALLGIHRPEKRNAFDLAMLRAFSAAMTEADRNPEVRCMVVLAAGDHFTAGLDLANVGPAIASGHEHRERSGSFLQRPLFGARVARRY